MFPRRDHHRVAGQALFPHRQAAVSFSVHPLGRQANVGRDTERAPGSKDEVGLEKHLRLDGVDGELRHASIYFGGDGIEAKGPHMRDWFTEVRSPRISNGRAANLRQGEPLP